MHVCTCMLRLEDNLKCPPQTHYPSHLTECLLLDWNALIRIDWLIREPQRSSASLQPSSPALGLYSDTTILSSCVVFVCMGQDCDQTQVPILPRQMLYWLACARRLYRSTAEVKAPFCFSGTDGMEVQLCSGLNSQPYKNPFWFSRHEENGLLYNRRSKPTQPLWSLAVWSKAFC